MLSRMFKTTKHQRYEYKPRYYDPVKEELKERVERAKKAKAGDRDAIKARMVGGLRQHRGRRSTANQAVRKSNMMLLGLVLALGVILYYVMNYYLPEIERYLQ